MTAAKTRGEAQRARSSERANHTITTDDPA